MEKCIKKIKELEIEARSEYAEEVEMTSDEFVEMMLLDCCFVLELLLEQLEQEKKRKREEEEKKLRKEMEGNKTIIRKLLSVSKASANKYYLCAKMPYYSLLLFYEKASYVRPILFHDILTIIINL